MFIIVIIIIATFYISAKTFYNYIKRDCGVIKLNKDTVYEKLNKKYNMTKQIKINIENLSKKSKKNSELFNIKEISNYLNEPLVVKPVAGLKGKDVYTDVTFDELYKIISNLMKSKKALRNKYVIIEEQVLGFNEARVLLTRDFKDITVLKRLPITVIGDGISTVEQLAKNAPKKTKVNNYKIVIDDRIVDRYRIPSKNEIVLVNNKRNISQGADGYYITDIHPDNKKLFFDIAKDLNVNFTGLDIFYIDLSISHKELPIILLEANACPGFKTISTIYRFHKSTGTFLLTYSLLMFSVIKYLL